MDDIKIIVYVLLGIVGLLGSYFQEKKKQQQQQQRRVAPPPAKEVLRPQLQGMDRETAERRYEETKRRLMKTLGMEKNEEEEENFSLENNGDDGYKKPAYERLGMTLSESTLAWDGDEPIQSRLTGERNEEILRDTNESSENLQKLREAIVWQAILNRPQY